MRIFKKKEEKKNCHCMDKALAEIANLKDEVAVYEACNQQASLRVSNTMSKLVQLSEDVSKLEARLISVELKTAPKYEEIM